MDVLSVSVRSMDVFVSLSWLDKYLHIVSWNFSS
jgi:hypothetical protein